MDEVEVLAVFNAFEQGRVPGFFDVEAFMHTELVRLFEQELEAQAHAEKGLAALYGLHYRRDEPVLFKVPHAVLERADAGQDNVARLRYRFRVARDDCLASDPFKGLGDAADIAHIIIYDGYHSLPFVESTPFILGSLATAMHKALPRAL